LSCRIRASAILACSNILKVERCRVSEMNADEKLDLIGVTCPINFVKTKLKLETMESGEVLEVSLDAGEALKNVPRSVKEEGHKILKAEKQDFGFKIYIEKV
jgi:tRNA 2-thiouridine synthesizing protein A